MDDIITPGFRWREFACHDGTPVPLEHRHSTIWLVLGVLHPVRERRGPIDVVSGYRTPEYNRRWDGAPDSAHMTAEASDIREVGKLSDREILALHDAIMSMRAAGVLSALGGLGLYLAKPGRPAGWVHVDIRKPADGHLRRWTG